jgi:hypothetical protein
LALGAQATSDKAGQCQTTPFNSNHSYGDYKALEEERRTLKFSVHGPFNLSRRNGLIAHSAAAKAAFWETVEQKVPNLPDACGCYVFVIRKRKDSKALPWYVGLTTKSSFRQEVFGSFQINHYNDAIGDARALKRGVTQLYLLAKRTPKDRLARPSKNSHLDIEFLETFMFGIALNRNGELRNSKNTKFFRRICVPGVINTPKRAPSKPEQSLRKDLGL